MQPGKAARQRHWAKLLLAGLSIIALFVTGWGISAYLSAQILPSEETRFGNGDFGRVSENCGDFSPCPQSELRPAEGVSAQGTTHYVAPAPAGNDSNPGTEPQPWATIQHAADTVDTAGDTVYIRAGIYQEQVIVQHSGSEVGGYITFAAYPGETVTIDGAGIILPAWETGLFVVEDQSYIKVSGLNIVNAGPNHNNAGIYVDNSHHIIIENNSTYNTVSSGIGVWGGDWGKSNIIIDGNEVKLACNGGEQEAITVSNIDIFEVKNNRVHDGGPGTNGGEGITIKGGATNGQVYKNHVYDLTRGQRTCIYIDAWGTEATSNIQVYQNILHNCSAGISLASEDGGLVRDVTIHNNIIYDNQTNGLEIGDWGEPWILVRPVESITFTNNTVYSNGSSGWGGGFFNENPDVKDIVVRNNIFSQNPTSQIVNESTASLTVDHNLIDGSQDYTYAISGTDYVTGDPLFANAAARDFHLQTNSPAIDRGSAVGAPGTDFESNARPQDGDGDGTATHDIGAYEVTASLSLSSITDPYPVEATTEVITYTITLQNNTGTDITATITSTIPTSTTYVSGGDSFVDPNVVWNGLAVSNGSSIDVSFQVSVTEVLTNGDRLTTAISASSAQGFTASIPINSVTVGERLACLPVVLKNH